jgi:plastocyanin
MKPGINLTLGTLMLVVVFGISTAALFGAAQLVDIEGTSAEADGEDGAGPGVPGGPVTARVVAKDLMFDRRSITASPGVSVTVTLDNQDPGVLHNIAFYTNRQASQRIAGNELFPGVATRELQFTAPNSPGNYFYRCDVHPDTMTGTFAVRP